jgi:lipoyl(octanoyl) transferase
MTSLDSAAAKASLKRFKGAPLQASPRRMSHPLQVRHLGSELDARQSRDPWPELPYVPVWESMRNFTAARTEQTPDELWLLNHKPVFTQGQAGKAEHLLLPGDIPVVQIDRGGQVTYHGPGQLVAYLMVDVRRSAIGVRELVEQLEFSVIDVLAGYDVTAQSLRKAPGVYVNGAKIAALGLRIRQGCSYHGLSFNIDMDLAPFARINPCGYEGLEVTQLRDHFNTPLTRAGLMTDAAQRLVEVLHRRLGYSEFVETRDKASFLP